MKRKASYLDTEGDGWPSRSPHSDSSAVSFGSPDRTALKPVPWNIWPSNVSSVGINGANPRTRKRFRDNRPDISMIHHNTLAKLYNAQKVGHPATSEICKPFLVNQDGCITQSRSQQHVPAQTSLHSFFNIRQPQPVKAVTSPLGEVCTGQISPHICSDCGNNLHSQVDSLSRDQNMMDIDYHQEEDYACVSCQRTVCDTCAVRGDNRVCLECALPGAG